MVALAACGADQGTPSVPPASTAPAPAPPSSAPHAAAAGSAWTTYGGAASRAGVAPGAPAAPHVRRRFARSVDGQVYAQPLIAGGRIYVATENNTVYAFTT